MPKIERPIVCAQEIDWAIGMMKQSLGDRLMKHGAGCYSGNHEMLGTITEEYDELIEAVRSNNNDAVGLELLDIAVACVFAVASRFALDRPSISSDPQD